MFVAPFISRTNLQAEPADRQTSNREGNVSICCGVEPVARNLARSADATPTESGYGQREPARAGKRRNSESVCEENTAIQTGARLFARVNCIMFITGVSTATPPRRYGQRECWEALQVAEPFSLLSSRSKVILKKVLLGDNGIDTRHLALDPLTEAFDLNPEALHARFVRHAPALATQAATGALTAAGLGPDDFDALIISTCTGYLCPALTSYVSERLGLRADVLTLDLVGQGCGAALPNLRAAEALLAAKRCENVLSICVEVCSAAFYLDNDPGVLISACLFGDGAAAAVLTREPSPNRRRVEWRAARSILSAEDRDYLRFEQRNGMLRNILARQVPGLAAKHAELVFAELLAETGMSRDRVSAWIMHAGGRDVLVAMRERLGLTEDDLRWSAAVLREYGNLSSPFVYFVLRMALADNSPAGTWWVSSFGAGFSCHGALLEAE